MYHFDLTYYIHCCYHPDLALPMLRFQLSIFAEHFDVGNLVRRCVPSLHVALGKLQVPL